MQVSKKNSQYSFKCDGKPIDRHSFPFSFTYFLFLSLGFSYFQTIRLCIFEKNFQQWNNRGTVNSYRIFSWTNFFNIDASGRMELFFFITNADDDKCYEFCLFFFQIPLNLHRSFDSPTSKRMHESEQHATDLRFYLIRSNVHETKPI